MALLKEVVQVKQILMEREFPYADSIRSTSQAAELAMKEIGESTQERMLLLVLNTKNEINAIHQVFVGTLSVSVAHTAVSCAAAMAVATSPSSPPVVVGV